MIEKLFKALLKAFGLLCLVISLVLLSSVIYLQVGAETAIVILAGLLLIGFTYAFYKTS